MAAQNKNDGAHPTQVGAAEPTPLTQQSDATTGERSGDVGRTIFAGRHDERMFRPHDRDGVEHWVWLGERADVEVTRVWGAGEYLWRSTVLWAGDSDGTPIREEVLGIFSKWTRAAIAGLQRYDREREREEVNYE